MSLSLGELAVRFGCELHGDPETHIERVATLANADWFASLPGTDQQKATIRNCTHCHTLERVMRTRADVDGLVKIVERMSTYPQLAFPLMPQKLVAARVGGGEDPLERRMEAWQRQARYLSTVNLRLFTPNTICRSARDSRTT